MSWFCLDLLSLRRLLVGAVFLTMLSSEARSGDTDRFIFLLLVKPPDDATRNAMISWSQLFGNNLGVILSELSQPGVSGDITPARLVLRRQDVDSALRT